MAMSGVRWHSRLISELYSRLQFLDGLATITTNKGGSHGSDIEVWIRTTGRRIGIEVQQFDSGELWKQETIPTWEKRHDLFTFVIFTEPALERVRSKTDSTGPYAFFLRPDVFLFAENQIPEIVALVGTIVLNQQGAMLAKQPPVLVGSSIAD